jgi:LEA14-like dessication related protein
MNDTNRKKMMRNVLKSAAVLMLVILIPGSCSLLKEISTFGKCEFRVTTLEHPELAGIDMSRIRSYSDLGIADLAIITTSIMKGEMPLTFTLNIEARNPNPATAALNKLEYLAFIDDVQIASGALSKRIEIPANDGIATIPLQLHTDLIEILKKDSRQALVNFGLNLADAGGRPTRVSLKVKPTVLVGGLEINYPGYFTVKYDFSSGG